MMASPIIALICDVHPGPEVVNAVNNLDLLLIIPYSLILLLMNLRKLLHSCVVLFSDYVGDLIKRKLHRLLLFQDILLQNIDLMLGLRQIVGSIPMMNAWPARATRRNTANLRLAARIHWLQRIELTSALLLRYLHLFYQIVIQIHWIVEVYGDVLNPEIRRQNVRAGRTLLNLGQLTLQVVEVEAHVHRLPNIIPLTLLFHLIHLLPYPFYEILQYNL